VKFNDPERLEARDPQRFDKRLHAERGAEAEVEHWPFAGLSDEAEAVAADIAARVADGARGLRDFAVLARTHELGGERLVASSKAWRIVTPYALSPWLRIARRTNSSNSPM